MRSGCYTRRDGVRDADLWAELQQAMAVMGLSEEENDSVFSCVAGVLNGGNLDFADVHTSGSEEPAGAPVEATMEFAGKAAALWQVEVGALVTALSQRHVRAGKEWFTIHLPAEKCRHSRDALCKAVYSSTFDWLVSKVNETIDRQRGGDGGGASPSGSHLFNWTSSPPSSPKASAGKSDGMFIGLLDVFGFESFTRYVRYLQYCFV
jgi:myosin heavy subunit